MAATDTNHDRLVEKQFSPRANAYLASAVHAGGEDLDSLATLIGERPEALALDLGCGGGHVTYRLARLVGQVVAFDLSADMLRIVATEATRRGLNNVTVKAGTVLALPFAPGSFDLLVSRYSAHHWRDLTIGLREAARVLKPGGQAVFMDVIAPAAVPADTFLQTVEMLRDPSHVRDYSAREWQDALSAAGLRPEAPVLRRLRLDYAPWIARMNTPAVQDQAIRALQAHASTDVAAAFALETDGSFTIDTMTVVATREVLRNAS